MSRLVRRILATLVSVAALGLAASAHATLVTVTGAVAFDSTTFTSPTGNVFFFTQTNPTDAAFRQAVLIQHPGLQGTGFNVTYERTDITAFSLGLIFSPLTLSGDPPGPVTDLGIYLFDSTNPACQPSAFTNETTCTPIGAAFWPSDTSSITATFNVATSYLTTIASHYGLFIGSRDPGDDFYVLEKDFIASVALSPTQWTYRATYEPTIAPPPPTPSSQVPEPGSVSLALLGLLVAGFIRRRSP